MEKEIYLLLIGLGVGSVYALSALGIVTLVNGSGLLNFGQGELMIIGALATSSAMGGGASYVVAALLGVGAVVIVSLVAGLLFATPLRRGGYDIDLVIIGTVGLAIFLQNGAGEMFGKQPIAIPSPLEGALSIGTLSVPYHYLLLIAAALVIYAAVHLLYTRTDFGLRMRAVSLDTEAARYSGLKIAPTVVSGWLIAGVVGSVGGILIASVATTSWVSGLNLTIAGFAAAMIGGLRSPRGAVLGGLLVGVAEMFSANYFDEAIRQSIAPGLILIILLLRPTGIVGDSAATIRRV